MISGMAGVNRGQDEGPAPPTAPVDADRRPVILYDGVCALCDGYVQFVLARDRVRRFRFAPLQGPFAAAALARHGLRGEGAPDSMMLLERPGSPDERVRLRSDAVLTIAVQLGGAWRLAVLLRVVPWFVRDVVYAAVARVRYRVFGRLDHCALPPAGSQDRFLD